MSKKSYRELAVQRCNDLLQLLRDPRSMFPALSDLARNRFWVIKTNAARERVFFAVKHVVNGRTGNLKS